MLFSIFLHIFAKINNNMDTVTITLIAMYFLSLIILSIAFISEWELIKTREQTEQALMMII